MCNRIRVLYVDDSRRATQIHAEMLSNHGFEVVTALTPAAGLDRLSRGGVDCVLSDLTMPETDGFEFLAAIRRPTRDYRLYSLPARSLPTPLRRPSSVA